MLDAKPGTRATGAYGPPSARVHHEGRPSVSVVSVSCDDGATLLRNMADRAARWQRLGVELIIVSASRQSTRSTVSAISGAARLIYGPADATEPQLRAIGFAAATGDVVMLVDDPTTADDGWIEHVSVTGAVRMDSEAHEPELDPSRG